MSQIELRNLGVSYQSQRIPTLKEWIVGKARGRVPGGVHWVLKGVDLDIRGGESVGVIGANGAGKSTLLRIIAGILTPTTGSCLTRGRLAPLIELGTGFDAELSGRENISFNGALLGRSRQDMARRADEIIEFAGLAESIDQPLRTYSTGMIARLAFAVATTVDADIILLDEILSVGDESFREKSDQRIRGFSAAGATLVLVSHSLDAILELCDRAVWIDSGTIRAQGSPHEVVGQYYRAVHGGGADIDARFHLSVTG